jgi:hypothetical protein
MFQNAMLGCRHYIPEAASSLFPTAPKSTDPYFVVRPTKILIGDD